MKFKIYSLLLLLTCSVLVNAQEVKKKKIYSSGGGEFIFSFANVDQNNESINLRFSAWLHLQNVWHYDLSKHLGLFAGVSLRNVGYVTSAKNNNVYAPGITLYNSQNRNFEVLSTHNGKQIGTLKRRVYDVGIPLGVKIGKVSDNKFVYLGAELEFPFHYKYKVWLDNEKYLKNSEWFSSQVNPVLFSVFFGFQLPKGYNLKFKWYFNDLMNVDYVTSVENQLGQTVKVKPYALLKSQMFYISFGMNMFRDRKRKKSYSYSI